MSDLKTKSGIIIYVAEPCRLIDSALTAQIDINHNNDMKFSSYNFFSKISGDIVIQEFVIQYNNIYPIQYPLGLTVKFNNGNWWVYKLTRT